MSSRAQPIGLTPEQSAAYERDGYVVVRGVVSADEIAALRRDGDRVLAPARRMRIPHADYTYVDDPRSGRPVLSRVDGMHTRSAAFWTLWGHPRLLAIGRSAQGDDVLPGAHALVVKTPGYGAPVPWHRDPAFCRVRHGSNVDVYLDDADAGNGMVWAIPGSHRRRCFPDLAAAVAEHGFALPGAVPLPMRAGDVLVHCENVLHGSPEVRATRERRVLYFGMRSVAEQRARGLGEDWVRLVARITTAAVAERAAGPLGRGETPFAWRDDAWWAAPVGDEHVERRIGGGDAGGLPGALPLGDEPTEIAAATSGA
ncbi:MAG TPA: phytanoyl-CoA dioxygenase family protein [Planctomycetota bacterium]|nr:phytanoyl-CoA dioxygenase family protein [Planctomycetota bacterium]